MAAARRADRPPASINRPPTIGAPGGVTGRRERRIQRRIRDARFPMLKAGSPATSVGKLRRDRRVGAGADSASDLGTDGSWRTCLRQVRVARCRGRAVGGSGGPAGVSTRCARPPLRYGPSGDTPSVPPLRQQLRALRPGLDGASRPSTTTRTARRPAVRGTGTGWRRRDRRGP